MADEPPSTFRTVLPFLTRPTPTSDLATSSTIPSMASSALATTAVIPSITSILRPSATLPPPGFGTPLPGPDGPPGPLMPKEYYANFPHDSRQPGIIACAAVTWSIAAFFVGLRFYTRIRIIRVLGWSDWLLLLALVFSAVMSANVIQQAVSFGLGLHVYDLVDPTAFGDILKIIWFAALWFAITAGFTKVSILVLYLDIFTYRWTRIVNRLLLGFVISFSLYGVAIILTLCVPIQAYWDISLRDETTYCHPVVISWLNLALHLLTNFLIVIIPLPVLWTLRIPFRQKAALVGLFGVGLFVCLVSALRTENFVSLFAARNPDFSYESAPMIYWTLIESNTAIVCASVLTLKPLLGRWFPKFFPSSAGSGEQDESGQLGQHDGNTGGDGAGELGSNSKGWGNDVRQRPLTIGTKRSRPRLEDDEEMGEVGDWRHRHTQGYLASERQVGPRMMHQRNSSNSGDLSQGRLGGSGGGGIWSKSQVGGSHTNFGSGTTWYDDDASQRTTLPDEPETSTGNPNHGYHRRPLPRHHHSNPQLPREYEYLPPMRHHSQRQRRHNQQQQQQQHYQQQRDRGYSQGRWERERERDRDRPPQLSPLFFGKTFYDATETPSTSKDSRSGSAPEGETEEESEVLRVLGWRKELEAMGITRDSFGKGPSRNSRTAARDPPSAETAAAGEAEEVRLGTPEGVGLAITTRDSGTPRLSAAPDNGAIGDPFAGLGAPGSSAGLHDTISQRPRKNGP